MSAVARMIKRRGATWYIQNWVEGASSNDYGRTSKTLAASIGFTAIRTETAKERTTIDVSGEERTIDAQLIAENIASFDDIENTTKLSPVVTSPSGVKYDAIALGREGEILNFRRVFLIKRRAE